MLRFLSSHLQTTVHTLNLLHIFSLYSYSRKINHLLAQFPSSQSGTLFSSNAFFFPFSSLLHILFFLRLLLSREVFLQLYILSSLLVLPSLLFIFLHIIFFFVSHTLLLTLFIFLHPINIYNHTFISTSFHSYPQATHPLKSIYSFSLVLLSFSSLFYIFYFRKNANFLWTSHLSEPSSNSTCSPTSNRLIQSHFPFYFALFLLACKKLLIILHYHQI